MDAQLCSFLFWLSLCVSLVVGVLVARLVFGAFYTPITYYERLFRTQPMGSASFTSNDLNTEPPLMRTRSDDPYLE